MDNEALMKSLVSWAHNEAVIDPPVFNCKYYADCNKSIGKTLWEGKGCLMSYVGRKYGSSAIGEGFRLVIVGIDHGEEGGGTFEDRRNRVEGDHQNGGEPCFKAHYKGVVRTAAAVFGRTGDYCRRKCTKVCQKSRDPAAAPHCVIDRIVQPNLVKCTREHTENAKSVITAKMKAKCAYHLASELEQLKPGLVVFHEASARHFVVPAFKACGLDMEAVEEIRPDRHGPVLYKSEALGAHVLFLYHPSYGHLDRQWETVVVPALDHLRSRELIPA